MPPHLLAIIISFHEDMHSTLNIKVEVNNRIAKAAAVEARLTKRVWNNSSLTEKTRLRVYQACVLSTLLCGSESWTTYAKQEKKLKMPAAHSPHPLGRESARHGGA